MWWCLSGGGGGGGGGVDGEKVFGNLFDGGEDFPHHIVVVVFLLLLLVLLLLGPFTVTTNSSRIWLTTHRLRHNTVLAKDRVDLLDTSPVQPTRCIHRTRPQLHHLHPPPLTPSTTLGRRFATTFEDDVEPHASIPSTGSGCIGIKQVCPGWRSNLESELNLVRDGMFQCQRLIRTELLQRQLEVLRDRMDVCFVLRREN